MVQEDSVRVYWVSFLCQCDDVAGPARARCAHSNDISGGILTAVYWRNRFAKLLIKLWCGVVIFSGGAQFVGMLLLDNMSLGEGLWSFSMLTIGLGFLLCNQSVRSFDLWAREYKRD